MIHEVQAFVLECDARGCQREWMGGADETVEETRYEASRAGWVADGGDLCPEHAHLEEKAADCGVSGCRACAAMRDRAKAKAADRVVEHMRPLMVTEAGRALMTTPAEPSGTGQVASTPVCDGGKAVACLLKIVEIVNSNGNQEVVFGDDGGGCALTVRIGNHGCHVHMGAGPRLAAGKPEDSRYVAKMVDELHDYLFSHECSERDKDGPREPIAEPPAPASGAPGTGAPAPKCDPDPPREVAPDRTQAGSGGQSDDDADEEAMIHDAARLVRRLQRLHPDDGTGSPTNLGWLARYERWRR